MVSNPWLTSRMRLSKRSVAALRAFQEMTCDCFSLAIDESTDITGVSQMVVFVRFSKQFIIKEEILTLLPLLNTTKDVDCFNALKNFMADKNIPLSKLCRVTADGAPAMTGVHSGVVGLMRKDTDFGKLV